MPRRTTKEEYIQKINKKYNNAIHVLFCYEPISTGYGMFKCNNCGDTFLCEQRNLLRRKYSHECLIPKRYFKNNPPQYTNQEEKNQWFQNKLDEKRGKGNFALIGDFINDKEHVTVECNKCGNYITRVATHILYDKRKDNVNICPKCRTNKREV